MKIKKKSIPLPIKAPDFHIPNGVKRRVKWRASQENSNG